MPSWMERHWTGFLCLLGRFGVRNGCWPLHAVVPLHMGCMASCTSMIFPAQGWQGWPAACHMDARSGGGGVTNALHEGHICVPPTGGLQLFHTACLLQNTGSIPCITYALAASSPRPVGHRRPSLYFWDRRPDPAAEGRLLSLRPENKPDTITPLAAGVVIKGLPTQAQRSKQDRTGPISPTHSCCSLQRVKAIWLCAAACGLLHLAEVLPPKPTQKHAQAGACPSGRSAYVPRIPCPQEEMVGKDGGELLHGPLLVAGTWTVPATVH